MSSVFLLQGDIWYVDRVAHHSSLLHSLGAVMSEIVTKTKGPFFNLLGDYEM